MVCVFAIKEVEFEALMAIMVNCNWFIHVFGPDSTYVCTLSMVRRRTKHAYILSGNYTRWGSHTLAPIKITLYILGKCTTMWGKPE